MQSVPVVLRRVCRLFMLVYSVVMAIYAFSVDLFAFVCLTVHCQLPYFIVVHVETVDRKGFALEHFQELFVPLRFPSLLDFSTTPLKFNTR